MSAPPNGVGIILSERGPAIQVPGGRFVPLIEPWPNEIYISDIAASLAKINRYTGHTYAPFSVAQHSVLVSYLVPPEDALWGLLHDAHETYMGDVSKPLKVLIEARAPGLLREIADTLDVVIAAHFGLQLPIPPTIKVADNILLATEKRDLFTKPRKWPGLPAPMAERLFPWEWSVAERAFMRRYTELSR